MYANAIPEPAEQSTTTSREKRSTFVPQYTSCAARCVDLAELFSMWFAGWEIGGGSYRIELSRPHGPSTDGGRQPVQRISLTPTHGVGTLVLGSVDQQSSAVSLSTYERLLSHYQSRFGRRRPLAISEEEYTRLVERLYTLFRGRSLSVTRIADEPEPESAPYAVAAVLLLCAAAAAVTAALTLG